jgi:predicted nucleotidyltransferase
VAVGYFGSYARGDWGVGSDLDLVVIVEASAEPFERRAVPVDLLVYTRAEWTRLASRPRDVVWLVGAD